jgi:hypothetical protein
VKYHNKEISLTKFTKCIKHKMNRKQSQNRTTVLSSWLELFYLQAVLPEQNDIIPLPTIKNSATPLFALNFAMCSRIPLSGNTVYEPPLAAWREVVWHEVALQ